MQNFKMLFSSLVITMTFGLVAQALGVGPDVEEIRDIYAFHAAYKLPENGKMIPGKSNNGRLDPSEKGEPLKDIAGWRPTLHFSLGSVCPDSAENTLSDRNHIIIVKIRDIESKLVGLHPFDSYLLGEFEVPHGASIIVPTEEVEETKTKEWVVSRNIRVICRNGDSIHEQVKKFVKASNNWVFYGKEENEEDAFPCAIKPTPLTLIKEVTQNFFQKFLDQAPHVEYARHCQHRIGFLDTNARYLLCKRYVLRVAGHAELRDLFDSIAGSYLSFLKDKKKDAEAQYLENKIKELRAFVLHTKQSRFQIQRLYFGSDVEGLTNHAMTWIAKGNYLYNKEIKPVRVQIDRKTYCKTKAEIQDYFKKIRMSNFLIAETEDV